MSDYIRREDALMAVCRADLPDKTEDGTPILNGKRKVSDCVRRIKAIPAADAIEELSKPRWIPVTERLPEDKERVLIFYWLSTKPKTPWYKVATFSKKLSDVDEYDLYGKDHPGFYGSDSEYGYYEHTDVEYWMPLPEPPKEGET